MATSIPFVRACTARMTSTIELAQKTSDFNSAAATIQIMTMKVSKVLEFRVVAQPASRTNLPKVNTRGKWRESVLSGGD